MNVQEIVATQEVITSLIRKNRMTIYDQNKLKLMPLKSNISMDTSYEEVAVEEVAKILKFEPGQRS